MPDDVVREMNLDGHSAVVALTHDPKLDDLALMEALKSAAFYVGAIGSKKNNDARRERLKEFDVSADEIARLRGPVGLYIGSKTPPEIAVAILAEMTAVRHGVSEPSWAAKPERRFDPSACEVPVKETKPACRSSGCCSPPGRRAASAPTSCVTSCRTACRSPFRPRAS
jgi:hypothetical protein